jgi:hypothetical protein
MQKEERQLKDLVSVGPAMLEDFELLGITTVAQLRRRSPQRMYRNLCRLRGQRIDPCCLDVFVAAVAQAKDPNLPIEQRQWWYWSKIRKAQHDISRPRKENEKELTNAQLLSSKSISKHADSSAVVCADAVSTDQGFGTESRHLL